MSWDRTESVHVGSPAYPPDMATQGRRTPLPFGSGVHGCGGGFEPPTFGLCDLTHLSMRVGDCTFIHEGCSPSSLYAFSHGSRGLGSVLPYRSRDVGPTDFDE
jgi:hypothetical protein